MVQLQRPSDPTTRTVGVLVAIFGALPSLVNAALSPALLLDDLEFAVFARFDGLAGFSQNISERPGEGFIHAVQFIVLGERASLHLLVLAAAAAWSSWLYWRLMRLVLPYPIAVMATVVFLLLPNRGSLRFWVSTVPNHVGLALFLCAAIVATRDAQRRRRVGQGDPGIRPWVIVVVLSVLSVLTYEGAAALVALVPLGIAATSVSMMWRWVAPAVAQAALATAALISLILSDRPDDSSLWGSPVHGFQKHLVSLGPWPLNFLLIALVFGAAAWSIRTALARKGDDRELAVAGCVALIAMVAGLAPFIVGGFNIENSGVLDRAHIFPNVGSAVLIAIGIESVRRFGVLPQQRLVLAGCAAIMFAAVFSDLGPYLRAADEQRDAAESFLSLEQPNADPVEEVRLLRPNGSGGVAWGWFNIQARALYQLTNDDPNRPTWLSLTPGRVDADSAPEAIAFVEVRDGNLVPLANE